MKNALREAIENRGYSTLTPVQQAVLEPELEGRDLLVSAQTGSGKTLGFGIAIAPALMGEAEQFASAQAPLGLVIAPTRELALQVMRELSWLYAYANATVTSCVGGMDMRDERRALGRGAHIVVATPGRLRDHIMRGSIDLTQLKAVVLDEADEMLDLGFREDLEFILKEAPQTRQTLLFSATVPSAITRLAKSYQQDAARVVAKSEESQHSDIEYRAMSVAERDTENAVINTLRYFEAPNAIVFANTRAMVNRLTTRLSNRGFQVVALSGELSQAERTHALQAMRDGRARVCVATDVAARGIDLPNLDLVVHAELPNNHETLLHRSGRTGRAGRKGVSALIVTNKSRRKGERILHMAKLKAEWTGAPSAEDVSERDQERMLADPDWHAPVPEAEQDRVAKLVANFSAEQIAAAYLRLYRASHSAPEELAAIDAKPQPRAEFGPSVWFAVAGGRTANAEPRRLLPMLCKAGDLTKDDIGAIRIQQDQSFVQIKQSSAAGFLAAIGPDMALETGAVVSQLDAPPVLERPERAPGKSPGKGPRKEFGKRKEYGDKPSPKAPAPAAKAPSNAPIEWNDAPPARARKPKPVSKGGKPPAKSTPPGAPPRAEAPKKPRKPSGALNNPSQKLQRSGDAARPDAKKPRRSGEASSGGPSKTRAPQDAKPGGMHKPRRASDAQPGRAAKPGRGDKGPPPPPGKPSSKKNRARASGKAPRKPGSK